MQLLKKLWRIKYSFDEVDLALALAFRNDETKKFFLYERDFII